MFGRATITLGIGSHSSSLMFFFSVLQTKAYEASYRSAIGRVLCSVSYRGWDPGAAAGDGPGSGLPSVDVMALLVGRIVQIQRLCHGIRGSRGHSDPLNFWPPKLPGAAPGEMSRGFSCSCNWAARVRARDKKTRLKQLRFADVSRTRSASHASSGHNPCKGTDSRSPWMPWFWPCAVIFGHRRDLASRRWLSLN